MRAFVTPNAMSKIDQETMKSHSLSSFELMDQVTDEMVEVLKADILLSQKKILVLCGPGNNGGDGYRLAEKLRKADFDVLVLEAMPAKSTDCVKSRALYKGKRIQKVAGSMDVIIDAIFGVNGTSDLPFQVSDLLAAANRSKGYRISLDVPTGVDTQRGIIHENAFRADLTLVVGFPKSVFVFEEVTEVLGSLRYIRSHFVAPQDSHLFAIEDSDFLMPKKKRTGHKGLYGRCGIVGGSAKFPGAGVLAAEAAHRVGAGYSTLFFAEPGALKLSLRDASFLFRLEWKMADLKSETALVLGCGGLPKRFSFKSIQVPMVLDAEALLEVKKLKQDISAPSILTPHPGEAARILNYEKKEILRDRLSALKEIAKESGQSVYLKGAPGLLHFSDEPNLTYVNLSSNPIFSKGGSGDILAGILGGFLAQSGRGIEFRAAVLDGIIFQRKMGELLREFSAAIASDHLNWFSKTFDALGA